MHIHIVPNRGSPPTVLLRESYREGSKVRKRTLANLSDLSAAQIEAMRAALRGEAWQPVAHSLEITASRAHGHPLPPDKPPSSAHGAKTGRRGDTEIIATLAVG